MFWCNVNGGRCDNSIEIVFLYILSWRSHRLLWLGEMYPFSSFSPFYLWRLKLKVGYCRLVEKMKDFAEYQKHRSVKWLRDWPRFPPGFRWVTWPTYLRHHVRGETPTNNHDRASGSWWIWMRRHEKVKKLFTLFAVHNLLEQSHTHSRYMARQPFALVKRDRFLCVIKQFRAWICGSLYCDLRVREFPRRVNILKLCCPNVGSSS